MVGGGALNGFGFTLGILECFVWQILVDGWEEGEGSMSGIYSRQAAPCAESSARPTEAFPLPSLFAGWV